MSAGVYDQVIYETSLKLSDIDWSPDGERLVMAVDRQIHRIDLGEGEIIKLTNHLGGASSPRWSPDGARISFVAPSSFPGFNQLMIMDADGRNIRQVANIRGDVVNGCWV